MSDNIARIKSTFKNIADGKIDLGRHHDFGVTLQAGIRLGLFSKAAAAEVLGVQPAHLYTKANALKPSEGQNICKKMQIQ